MAMRGSIPGLFVAYRLSLMAHFTAVSQPPSGLMPRLIDKKRICSRANFVPVLQFDLQLGVRQSRRRQTAVARNSK